MKKQEIKMFVIEIKLENDLNEKRKMQIMKKREMKIIK